MNVTKILSVCNRKILGVSWVRASFSSEANVRTPEEKYPEMTFDEQRNTHLLDGIDLNEVIPKYKNLKAMEDANDMVKKVYSWKFVSFAEKMENLEDLHEEVLRQYDGDEESLEVKIIKLTLRIRLLKKRLMETNKKRKTRSNFIIEICQIRNSLLYELRNQNFDRYLKIMKELDLKLTLPPVVDLRQTARSSLMADMKIRTFAEKKRLQEVSNRRKNELREKEEEFENKIRNGEIDLDNLEV